MKAPIDRRRFLHSSGLALAAPALAVRPRQAEAGQFTGRVRKALGYPMIQEDLPVADKLRLARDAGFEGIETPSSLLKRNTPEPRVLAQASQKVGIAVHGVVNSNHPDLKTAIDEAALYGATSVLHVVRADPDGSFLENYRHTQQIIRKAVPHAEKKQIAILIENVWATFLIEPLSMARYIDELDSPYVKAYFDVGNVLRWGWPQHWIEVLGPRIAKIHIKEFNLQTAMNEGLRHGFNSPIGQGSVPWDKVRQELGKINFQGWATAEVRGGDRQRLAEISRQMDEVLDL